MLQRHLAAPQAWPSSLLCAMQGATEGCSSATQQPRPAAWRQPGQRPWPACRKSRGCDSRWQGWRWCSTGRRQLPPQVSRRCMGAVGLVPLEEPWTAPLQLVLPFYSQLCRRPSLHMRVRSYHCCHCRRSPRLDSSKERRQQERSGSKDRKRSRRSQSTGASGGWVCEWVICGLLFVAECVLGGSCLQDG